MSTLNNTDLFLVERDGQNYQITSEQMSTLNPTDLLLVEREGVQYKVEAVDVVVDPITGELETPVEVLTPLNGAGIGAGVPYNPISSPIVTVGAGGSIDYETSNITNVAPAYPGNWYVTSSPPANLAEAEAGTPWTDGTPGVSGYMTFVPDGTVSSGQVWAVNGGHSFNDSAAGSGVRAADGSYITAASGDYNSSDWVNFTFSDGTPDTTPYVIWTGPTVGYQTFSLVGTATTAERTSTGTELTLANSTNFDKFQVGDEVGVPGGASTVIYTGNAGTQSITGVGFLPDLVWIKCRDQAYRHCLYDALRGPTELLSSSSNDAEVAETRYGYLSSFDSNGFTLSPGSNDNDLTHRSGADYLAWCWDAGDGSPVTNNDGSIQSTVKASDKTGFSIVSYTGTGLADTVGHGLSTAPEMIIVKNRDSGFGWNVYHIGADSSNPGGYYLRLSETFGVYPGSTKWNDTNPTSSVFSVGSANTTNANGDAMIAYCWAGTPGVSKFGSYTGNGGIKSITTGFEPAWLMVKRTDDADSWFIFDSKRNSYLVANEGSVEASFTNFSLDSNGFTLSTSGAGLNASGGEYVYAAFSEQAIASITDINELASQMTLDADIKDVGDTLSKTSTYEASLTCSDSTELSNMVGPISMTDENGDLVTPQTSEITGVSGTAPAVTLTFADNTGLEYFSPGDVVQSDWNQSQVWSDNFTGTEYAAFPVSNGFDGDTSTFVYGADTNSAVLTVNFTNVTGTIFEVFAWSGQAVAGGQSPELEVNNTSIGNYDNEWVDVSAICAGQLNSITMKSATSGVAAAPGFTAVRVDGKLLADQGITDPNAVSVVSVNAPNSQMVVDGGEWTLVDDSQVWSDQVTGSANQNSLLGQFTSIFDGDLTTRSAAIANSSCSFSPGFGSSWKVYFQKDGSADPISINGSDYTTSPASGSGPLNSVIWSTTAADQWVALYGIEIDGKVLVNAVNDSQVWSNQITLSNASGSSAPEKAFDGAIVRLEGANTVTDFDNTVSTATLPVTLNNSTVRVYYGVNTGQSRLKSLTAGDKTTTTANNEVGSFNTSFVEVSGATGSSILIEFEQVTGASSNYIYQIVVDDKVLLDSGTDRGLGDTSISLPTLEASATDVVGVDGNALQIDGVSGTWKTGLRIKGASISSSAPSPDSIVFTSSNGGTTAVTGTDATLSSRVWTLEKSSSQTGPWTVVGEYTDLDANASQDGATPWSGKPVLEENTFYQVKVKYTSDNAEPVESTYSTFKTGDA